MGLFCLRSKSSLFSYCVMSDERLKVWANSRDRVREGALVGASSMQDKVSPRDNTFATYAQRFGLNRGN
jgi:hypothetical protein